jgi:hypothetical protein
VIHSAANTINSDLAGVTFTGGNSSIHNNGYITGQIDGVVATGDGIAVNNAGTVLGLEGSGVSLPGVPIMFSCRTTTIFSDATGASLFSQRTMAA